MRILFQKQLMKLIDYLGNSKFQRLVGDRDGGFKIK